MSSAADRPAPPTPFDFDELVATVARPALDQPPEDDRLRGACFAAFCAPAANELSSSGFSLLLRALFPQATVQQLLAASAELFAKFDRRSRQRLDADDFRACWRWIRGCLWPRSALVVVDVQNDFVDGSLAVNRAPAGERGEQVVPIINRLIERCAFDLVVYTLDWHPKDHVSFFENRALRRVERRCAPASAEETPRSEAVVQADPLEEQTATGKVKQVETQSAPTQQKNRAGADQSGALQQLPKQTDAVAVQKRPESQPDKVPAQPMKACVDGVARQADQPAVAVKSATAMTAPSAAAPVSPAAPVASAAPVDPAALQLFDKVVFRLSDGEPCEQTLWPAHCVQGSWGAQLHPALSLADHSLRVYKGQHSETDSYSAFFDNRKRRTTTLHRQLQEHRITDLYVCGLAYDVCVGETGLHALELGYRTALLEDATRGLDLLTIAQMRRKLAADGAAILPSSEPLPLLVTGARRSIQMALAGARSMHL